MKQRNKTKFFTMLLAMILALCLLNACASSVAPAEGTPNVPGSDINADSNDPQSPPSEAPGAEPEYDAPAEDAPGGYWDTESDKMPAIPSNGENVGNESYTEIIENAFVNAAETPNSYFSIDANTASYPNLRSMIQNGYLSIPKDAVRIEEMLNYFNYDYQAPTDGSMFSLTSSVFDTPYHAETKLLTIGLAAQKIEFENVQNNLVFLLDVSGSMYDSDKLPLIQQAFTLLAENLNPNDRISIVTYASGDRVVLDGARGDETQKIIAAIESLEAGGSTAGSRGIQKAYELALQYFIEGGNNRVILATDGDFNVGISNTTELGNLIAQKRQTGIYFSVIGVGRGNLKSDKMETLALQGNGTYHYIDSVKEAKRALVEEIGGSMVTVARDVKAGISFNPEYVESYRLIGYENKKLSQDQFEDENTDAGEIGSGHTLTVVYEIKLTDKALAAGEHIAQVILRYKPTENSEGDTETKEVVLDVKTEAYHAERTDTDTFVAGVVEFGLLLRESEYKGQADLDALIARLRTLDLANDEFKQEFVDLVATFREIYLVSRHP